MRKAKLPSTPWLTASQRSKIYAILREEELEPIPDLTRVGYMELRVTPTPEEMAMAKECLEMISKSPSLSRLAEAIIGAENDSSGRVQLGLAWYKTDIYNGCLKQLQAVFKEYGVLEEGADIFGRCMHTDYWAGVRNRYIRELMDEAYEADKE